MDRGARWASVKKTPLLGGKSYEGILQDTGRLLIQVITGISPPRPPSPGGHSLSNCDLEVVARGRRCTIGGKTDCASKSTNSEKKPGSTHRECHR